MHNSSGAKQEEPTPSEHSIWPIVLSLGMLLLAVGLLTQIAVAAIGVVIILVAVVNWLWQPWVSP